MQKQNYKIMHKVLKLLQAKPYLTDSPIKCEGIFDRQAYEQSFCKVSSSSCIEDMIATKFQRIALSQNTKKYKAHSFSLKANETCLKKEIQPHQAKMIKCKIADLIKDNLNSRQKAAKQSKFTNFIVQRQYKDKKSSYSAYISARKKILARQNPNDLNFTLYGKQRGHSLQDIRMEIDHKQQERLLIDKQQIFEQKIQSQQNYAPTSKIQEKNLLPTNLVYRPRLQVIKSRREICFLPKELQKPMINQIKTLYIRRGFVTIIKKVKGQSQLIVSNAKPSKSKQSIQIQTQDKSWCCYFSKFKNQQNITQDNIELFPQIQKLNIQKIQQFGKYNIENFNSKSISIFHYDNGKLANIFGNNQKQRLQIASITKVMTCYLILNVAQKFQIDIKKQKVMVSERAAKMPGTSANLCYGDTCTVYDLLHGMMLPSGNDSATALGEWGGKTIRKCSAILKRLTSQQSDSNNNKSINFLNNLAVKRKSNIKLFVYHMNKLAKHLHLTQTYFVNTHGLMNEKAHSCSYDVAILTYHAMKNHIFKQIVRKKTYRCKLFNRTFSHSKQTYWQSTNKLLAMEGFLGVKTGITPAAGPCLTSLFQVTPQQYFIISILKTKSCEMRFKQTVNLLKATLTNLIESACKTELYKSVLEHLQDHNKIDSKEDDLELLNDCQQSMTSHSDKQDDDNIQF